MKVFVSKASQGLRLDQFLIKAGFSKSRSQALRLITQGWVRRQNQPLKASFKLKAGDGLEICLPESGSETDGRFPLYDVPVEVVYEDEEILTVNKPAGLAAHPAPGHETDTLVNVFFQKKALSPGTGASRPGIVHRLDREASGLLVLAKTKAAEESLVSQFKARSVQRVYWAAALGAPRPAEGVWESYLSRHPARRQKFLSTKELRPGAKKAITSYKILKTHSSGLCWAEARLKTGRTHQIRAHFSAFGHPLAGDWLYGKKRRLKSIKGRRARELCGGLGRIALHACLLGFAHPGTGREVKFFRPWPLDLKDLLLELDFWEEGKSPPRGGAAAGPS